MTKERKKEIFLKKWIKKEKTKECVIKKTAIKKEMTLMNQEWKIQLEDHKKQKNRNRKESRY